MHKKTVRYIAFLSCLAAVPPLSTDMYLAAIPKIAEEWSTSTELITLSLTLWFVAFSFGLLLNGSLSDKYGRRPVLLTGLICFTLSSALCSIATSPLALIIFRILQGVGASAPSSMAMAVCRDRFSGNTRKIALAYIGIMLSLAPILAPPIGSVILEFLEWQVIFMTQAASGVIIFVMTLKYTETNKELLDKSLFSLLGRYFVLMKNKGYILTTLTLGMLSGPFYGNIAFSPIVYIELFSRSDFEFSLFFALTACASILGAVVFTRLNERIDDMRLLSFCFSGIVVAGIAMVLTSNLSYLAYFSCAAVISFFTGMSRPVSNSLILGFVDRDIGSASSFMIFYQFIFGAVCMSYASYQWEEYYPVTMFGLMVVVVGVGALVIWQGVKRFSPAG